MKRVLIVNRNGVAGSLLESVILSSLEFGTDVSVAKNATEAREMTDNEPFDCIIASLDIFESESREELELLVGTKKTYPLIRTMVTCFNGSPRQQVWELVGEIDPLTPHPYNFADLLDAIRG